MIQEVAGAMTLWLRKLLLLHLIISTHMATHHHLKLV